jgi:hypothetical protein
MGFTVKATVFLAIFFFASVFLASGLISVFGVSSGISTPSLPSFPSDLNWLNPASYGAIFSFVWGVISYIITSIANFLMLMAYLPSPLNVLMYSIFALFFIVVLMEWVRG